MLRWDTAGHRDEAGQSVPVMVVQMTAIGEEAGALDTMLFKVAEFYEQEVNNAVDALSSLLEPFIMVIIGSMVGGLVIGMYLPIFKLAAPSAEHECR
jgi:type IV pilus assembly protein PilC